MTPTEVNSARVALGQLRQQFAKVVDHSSWGALLNRDQRQQLSERLAIVELNRRLDPVPVQRTAEQQREVEAVCEIIRRSKAARQPRRTLLSRIKSKLGA